MTWIQTFTGKKFDLVKPDPALIDIVDIAHALAHQCRFAGHTKTFYSVAQHSNLVSVCCPPSYALEGLLHDAAEAYLVDLSRPVKALMRSAEGDRVLSAYDILEDSLMSAIAARFGFAWPMPPCIKQADTMLLATEARDLMSPLHPDWHHQQSNGYPVLAGKIVPWEPAVAKRNFLQRFEALHSSRSA